MTQPIVKASNLARFYEVKDGFLSKPKTVKALAGVDFELSPGKTLAVVGESGCGKSTLARLITMIEEPTEGTLNIDGTEITPSVWADMRETVAIVFQDPYGSLNPRQRIGQILEEPLVINRRDMSAADREAAAREMIEMVGLRPEHYDRYPHMFSGGQRQRIAIARALMLDPKVLVLDEPVSALDVSIQSQILNLLVELQDRLDLAYLFISHDLSVVKHFADDVIVMYLARAVEKASKETLFETPRHPYSKALLSTTPHADPEGKKERIKLEGELPSPMNVPLGCAFAARCWLATEACRKSVPNLEGTDHKVACLHPL
ncbi:dipeptide transport system ATP-binding protein [Shimia gijangensis]|uniref:Dipeptide transport system ATP-binding protein n=1 Tax=Shimia gijangensis TaxID=1470563 RepID=A0A1M6LUV1_9RHOB|nr:dipeptide ABC transporter ATP-binding protein [Shimia gijangensis]SHJ74941.1 dipeptide transport system ATP-binding protein [Shimia gijangensis]